MKFAFYTTFFSAIFSTQLSLARGDSQVFSQYAGAPTVTAMGPSASLLTPQLKICTDYLHEVSPIDNNAQEEQEVADEVCEACTSLDISRIDSCCAQAASVACFGQFAATSGNVASTTASGGTPATGTATVTAGSASTPTNTKASDGNRIDTGVLAGSVIMAMFGLVSWAW